MSYRAVLVDLDGTLLDARSQLSRRTERVIAAVEASGVRVMVATGRSVVATQTAVGHRGWATEWCCYNGAAIVCSRSLEWLRQLHLDEAACHAAIDALAASELDMIVQHEDVKYAGPTANRRVDELLARMKRVERTTTSGLPRERVTRISAVGDLARLRETLATVDAAHGERLELLFFPLDEIPGFAGFGDLGYCDIQPASRGKAEGIAFLTEVYGIEPAEMIAIGDHINDAAMIEAAGRGVAMANAAPALIALAHEVIGHHDDDGLAAFLERELL